MYWGAIPVGTMASWWPYSFEPPLDFGVDLRDLVPACRQRDHVSRGATVWAVDELPVVARAVGYRVIGFEI